jgi:hypothetical protein
MVRKIVQVGMCIGSKVVEHSTHYPKVECSNPTASTGREKISKVQTNMVVQLG